MFYSQFILAKKGPLGTIWIAAHLERKLRKNQVADTDIGVSVGKLLFFHSMFLVLSFFFFLLRQTKAARTYDRDTRSYKIRLLLFLETSLM